MKHHHRRLFCVAMIADTAETVLTAQGCETCRVRSEPGSTRPDACRVSRKGRPYVGRQGRTRTTTEDITRDREDRGTNVGLRGH